MTREEAIRLSLITGKPVDQVIRKGIFTAIKDSVVGVFSLIDNTISFGNRTVDQGHLILNVSEANLKVWEQDALNKLENEVKLLEESKA